MMHENQHDNKSFPCKNHKCCDIDLHKQIKTDTDKVTEDLEKAGKLITSFEQDKDDWINQFADIEGKINETADSLIDTIQCERKKLLLEVESIRRKRVRQLKTAKEGMEQHMAALESLRQSSETLLSTGTAYDVSTSSKTLHDRVKELTKSDIIGHMQFRAPAVNFTPVNRKPTHLIGVISEADDGATPTVTVLPKGKSVTAVTLLDDDVFVARCDTQHVEVYDAVTFTLRRHLAIPGLGSRPYGLAACAVNDCLYVSDWDNNLVHRAASLSQSGLNFFNEVVKWSVASKPVDLSVNSAQNVLVVSRTDRKLQEFTTRENLVRNIQLQPDTEDPMLSADKFLVSHTGATHRVCMLDGNGAVLLRCGGPPGSGMMQMSWASGLAVDKYGNVLVADPLNHRLLVLEQFLSTGREMPVSVDGGLAKPFSVFYDGFRRRLYVGECSGGRVIIIDNVHDFRSPRL